MKKLLIIVLLFVTIDGIAQSTLYTKDTLAVNQVFRQRVKSATIVAANQIATDTTQASWTLQFANEVIKNPDGGWIAAITYQVVANPVISYESSDNDIQFAVNSNFEKVARSYFGSIAFFESVYPKSTGLLMASYKNTVQWPLKFRDAADYNFKRGFSY